MRSDSVYFKGYLCFQKEWAGFDTIKPINVIIGRNNSGKSHLLDLVEALSQGELGNRGWQYRCRGVLDEVSLRRRFHENTSRGELGGNHWHDHGRYFVGAEITWEVDANGNTSNVDFPDGFTLESRSGPRSTEARLSEIKGVVSKPTHELNGTSFRRLLADRDIQPEKEINELTLESDGRGASNIIRRFINTANPRYPSEVIQHELLNGLSSIFGGDGQFSGIWIKSHDDEEAPGPRGHWEVYLDEEKKGSIPLSKSGSGLKTVLLVLLNLLVIPKIEDKEKSQFVFAFEELENNLHPALLRRLFQYLEKYALDEQATIFLTTHSSTALDFFGVSENAQIIHVTHDGETARTTTVSAHFAHLEVLSELGAKPSDLLQANGIVWVEGPSDRIYLNRWIQLYSEGALREGRDYQCAFYGGALLARVEFQPAEEETEELVNLFRVNSNIIVMCDGDRASENFPIKDRVERIRKEVENIPGAHIWITAAREIENYLPGSVLEKALDLPSLPDPERYAPFFPRTEAPDKSYLEANMSRKHFDKMHLATRSVPYMTKDIMAGRFDWEDQMKAIVCRIKSWNT